MKNILHKLCIRLKLYREIYNGHFDIVKTLAGTYFIDGNYAPLTLKRCIELERGYHQECYMKMEHDVQKNATGNKAAGTRARKGLRTLKTTAAELVKLTLGKE